MNGARTLLGLKTSRVKQPRQPGCIARMVIAARLLLRGHSWQFATDEAKKVIE